MFRDTRDWPLHNPEETHEPQLVAGYHAPQVEIDFVHRIVRQNVRIDYEGRISIFGSREHGRWISWKRFLDAAEGLSGNELNRWFDWINTQAISQNLVRGEIPVLKVSLPAETPPQVRDFLSGTYGVPGSDIDLLLNDATQPIRQVYSDWDTGQVVDILSPQSVR